MQDPTPTTPSLSPANALDGADVTELRDAVKTLTEAVTSLAARFKAGRNFFIGIAASIALDICLTVGLGVVAWQNHTTARRATNAAAVAVAALQTSRRASCIAGNDFRSTDLQRWQLVERLLGTAPTVSKAVKELEAFDKKADKQRNCG